MRGPLEFQRKLLGRVWPGAEGALVLVGTATLVVVGVAGVVLGTAVVAPPGIH